MTTPRVLITCTAAPYRNGIKIGQAKHYQKWFNLEGKSERQHHSEIERWLNTKDASNPLIMDAQGID